MKNIIIFLGIIIAVGFVSCDDNISDLNIDPKAATEVDPQVLFSYGLEGLSRQMTNIEYNYNVDRFWANFLTQTTYIEECSYDPVNRDIGGSLWDNIYEEMLIELKSAKALLRAQEVSDAVKPMRDNKLAMISVLEVYAYQYLVDNFGDIPYSEALDITNTTPAYDDATTIYLAISDSLEVAIANMDITKSGFDSTYDLLYGGDMGMWKKFASSLQLKLGIRLSDVNATKAASLVTNAVANGVFTSNADNASFNFLGSEPYVNPIYNYFETQSRSGDFIASDFFVNLLNDYNDPRISYYLDDNIATGYVGGVYGKKGNTYGDFSHVSPTIVEPTYPGILMDYAAVSFSLAEAVERGFISGDAEVFYVNGITASFDFWGVPSTDLSTYLLESDVVYDSASYKEKIGVQKYFAAYNQGHEAWTEARRLDYPVLVAAASNGVPNPKRLLYPNNEDLINEVNYNAAATAIGGDKLDTSIFWDVN
ncbi:SusD/RagB family nutrient-binding outer membrane lipoprotein [Labilibaculum euxinus]